MYVCFGDCFCVFFHVFDFYCLYDAVGHRAGGILSVEFPMLLQVP